MVITQIKHNLKSRLCVKEAVFGSCYRINRYISNHTLRFKKKMWLIAKFPGLGNIKIARLLEIYVIF